jgi:hypothetical protein
VGGHQLLDEERVAAAAQHQLVDQRGGWLGVQQLRRLPGQLRLGERTEVDAVGMRGPAELGHRRMELVGTRQRVGPERHRDQHARAAERPRQVDQRVGGGPVGPVQVLDDEDHRVLGREVGDHRPQRVQQSQLGQLAGQRRCVDERRREQVSQLRRVAADERHDRRGLPRRVPQQGRHRSEGDARAGQRHAVGAQHQRSPLDRGRGELREEPGLPDSRLTRHDRDGRSSGPGPVERRP